MPGPLAVVDEGMDPPLDHRFVVRLHPRAGDVHQDRERKGGACPDVVEIRADDGDFSVLDLLAGPHPEELERGSPSAAKLHVHLLLADALPLECRRTGHGYRYRRDRDPDPPEVHAGPDRLRGSDPYPLAPLVAAAGREDRYAEHPQGIDERGLLVGEAAKHDHERFRPLCGIPEQGVDVSRLHPPKHHRDPGEDVGEVDAVSALWTERHQAVIQPQADTGAGERLHDTAGEEGEQVLLLHLPAYGRGGIRALRCPDEETKARDAPVDQGVAEPPEDRIRYKAGIRACHAAFAGHQAFAGDEEIVAGLPVCLARSVCVPHGYAGDGVGHGEGVCRLRVGEFPGECLHPRVEAGATVFYRRNKRIRESVLHDAFNRWYSSHGIKHCLRAGRRQSRSLGLSGR
ncbi:hypothetical protein DSECCO2_640490 [anaerobic digester metagenome]